MTLAPNTSRTRGRDASTLAMINQRFTNTNGGDSSASYVAGFNGEKKTTKDVNHPGYLKSVKRGDIVLGDFRIDSEERTSSPVDWSVTYLSYGVTYTDRRWGYWSQWFQSAIPAPSMVFPPIEGMMDAALIKAYAKMNSSPVLAGEILNDLDRSLGMLRRPFKSATGLLSRMVKYRSKRLGKTAASAAKATANTWLEYRYGWSPLIMDAENIIQGCYSLKKRAATRRLVVRASEVWESEKTANNPGSQWGSPLWIVSGDSRQKSVREAHAGVLYRVDPGTILGNSAQYMGLTTRDIPATLWEIVPYSFVVDWFVGVGSWIQAITPVPGIQVLGNWVTSKEIDSITKNPMLKHTYGLDNRVTNVNCGAYNQKITAITRITNKSLSPTPIVDRTNPGLLHTTDALALSAGRILDSLGRFRH